MKKTLLILISLAFSLQNITAQDAKTILAKMDNVMFFAKDKQANVELKIENLKKGKVTEKRAKIYEKGTKKIFRYVYPKSDSGITSLTISANETYIYLPLFNMVKKITTSSSLGNMNKSDFSLADKPAISYSDSYTPELEKTTEKFYVLKLTPENDKNPYGFLKISVDKKYFYPHTIEYYGKDGKLIKKATYHFVKLNGHWVTDKISMLNENKQSKTTIVMKNIKINKGLPDSMFTKEGLKKKKSK